MKATIILEDLSTLEIGELSTWALNPDYEQADVTVYGETVDAEGEIFGVEMTFTKEDVENLLDSIIAYRFDKMFNPVANTEF